MLTPASDFKGSTSADHDQEDDFLCVYGDILDQDGSSALSVLPRLPAPHGNEADGPAWLSEQVYGDCDDIDWDYELSDDDIAALPMPTTECVGKTTKPRRAKRRKGAKQERERRDVRQKTTRQPRAGVRKVGIAKAKTVHYGRGMRPTKRLQRYIEDPIAWENLGGSTRRLEAIRQRL